jgi:LPXTG-motif cell wall-anchored protein
VVPNNDSTTTSTTAPTTQPSTTSTSVPENTAAESSVKIQAENLPSTGIKPMSTIYIGFVALLTGLVLRRRKYSRI